MKTYQSQLPRPKRQYSGMGFIAIVAGVSYAIGGATALALWVF